MEGNQIKHHTKEQKEK